MSTAWKFALRCHQNAALSTCIMLWQCWTSLYAAFTITMRHCYRRCSYITYRLLKHQLPLLDRFCPQPPAHLDLQLSFSQDGTFSPIYSQLVDTATAQPDLPGEACTSATCINTLQTHMLLINTSKCFHSILSIAAAESM